MERRPCSGMRSTPSRCRCTVLHARVSVGQRKAKDPGHGSENLHHGNGFNQESPGRPIEDGERLPPAGHPWTRRPRRSAPPHSACSIIIAGSGAILLCRRPVIGRAPAAAHHAVPRRLIRDSDGLPPKLQRQLRQCGVLSGDLAPQPRCIEGRRKVSKNALYTLYSVKKCRIDTI